MSRMCKELQIIKEKRRTQLKMDKIFEQTFHERDYPNGQWAGENQLNLINQLQSTNENHIEGLLVVKNPLPTQGTQVGFLVRDDSTRHGVMPQLLSLYSRARESQPRSPRAATTEAWAPTAHALQQDEPPKWEAHTPQLESSPHSLWGEEAPTAMKTRHSHR